MTRSTRWLVGPLTLLVTFGVAPAQAQTLRGTIVDSSSGRPMSLAYVGLLAEGRHLVVATLTGETGQFALDAPVAGAYFVYVSRTGFETLMDGVFELGTDGVFDVRIGLKPAPLELEPVLVEANRDVSRLEASGFYERAAVGNGTFIVQDEIERRVVERITDAFRGIPNVLVDTSRPPIGSPDVMRAPAILVSRAGRPCNPTLYVDGAVVSTGALGAARPDDFVGPRDVEAIEVYTHPSEIPVRFGATLDCGVVLIWTKVR